MVDSPAHIRLIMNTDRYKNNEKNGKKSNEIESMFKARSKIIVFHVYKKGIGVHLPSSVTPCKTLDVPHAVLNI